MEQEFNNFIEEIYEIAKLDWAFYPIARLFVDDLRANKLPLEYLNSLNHQEVSITITKKRINIKKGEARKLIDKFLKISDVAKKFGYKVENNKMICPFHNDSDPSLVLNDKLNIYHCFGCNLSGDIIDFVGRLEEWKDNKQ